MKRVKFWVAAGVVLLVFSGRTQAGYVYQFVTDKSSYVEDLGSQFDVTVYLQETVTDGDASRLAGVDAGLVSAGVIVTFGPAAPARVLTLDDIITSPAFSDTLFSEKALSADDGSASFFEAIGFSDDPVQGIETSAEVHQIKLGTFRFHALSAGRFNLLIAGLDDDPFFDRFVTADFTSLDQFLSPASVSITVRDVNAIPEPASLVLLSLGAVGALAARRFRKTA